MANPRGIQLPSALIRPTPPETDGQPIEGDDQGETIEAGEGQSRGDARPVAPRTRRRKPVASSEKTSKRGVYLTDGVWDRLQLEAIRRRTSVSAVAGEFLDRNLPRLRIERDA